MTGSDDTTYRALLGIADAGPAGRHSATEARKPGMLLYLQPIFDELNRDENS